MQNVQTGVDGAGFEVSVAEQTGMRSGPFRVVALLTTAMMLFGGLLLSPAASAQEVGDQQVTTDNLNFRDGPALDAEILDVIPVGTTVEVGEAAGNGYVEVVYGGQEGFAHGDWLVDPDAAPESPATAEPWVNGADGWSGDELVQIIYSAADMYGQPRADMLRVAQCESNLNPYVVNPASNASGLFQFLPSTWATTPYAGLDIFDPVANAEAAAWMWANGRRGEWVCQ